MRDAPITLVIGLMGLSGALSVALERRSLRVDPPLEVLPSDFVALVAGSHKPLAADLFYIQGLQFIGRTNPSEGPRALKEREIDYLLNTFRIVSALDPKFLSPCFMGGIAITYDAMSSRKAIQFLEEAWRLNPEEWRIPLWIAFNYFHHLHQARDSLRYFQLAAERSTAPAFIRELLPMVYYDAGDPETGVAYLEGLQASLGPSRNQWVERKLSWLRAIALLERAVRQFTERFSRMPDRLEELISKGFLQDIPQDPFGKGFLLDPDTGRIRSKF